MPSIAFFVRKLHIRERLTSTFLLFQHYFIIFSLEVMQKTKSSPLAVEHNQHMLQRISLSFEVCKKCNYQE